MRYFVFIGVLCLCVTQASAQSLELKPIRIVGDINAVNFSELKTSTIDGYFSNNSGIDVQQRMGFGHLQDVSIRGGIFEDTDVALNGVSLNNPQTGHFHMSLPVVSLDIKGADVALNSQKINFDLVDPFKQDSLVRMAGGNGGFAETAVTVVKKNKKYAHRFSAEGMRTDGLRDETDSNRYALSYTFAEKDDDHDALVYVAVSEKKFGAAGAYAAPWYMAEEEHIKQEFFMAELVAHNDLDITIKPSFHRTQDVFWLDRNNPSFYRNDHTTFVAGNVLKISDPDTGRFASFEFERNDMRSTNLGAHNRFFYAGEFGLDEQHYGDWGYSGSVKAKYFDEYPLEILPKAEVFYQINGPFKVYVKGERKMRQPSFTELYYNSPSNAGNENLNVQSSDNFEIGAIHQIDGVTLGFDVFARKQKNTIDWTHNNGETVFTARNVGDVIVRGFDINLEADIVFPGFDKLTAAYTRTDVSKDNAYDFSKYVFDYLRDRAILELSGKWGRWQYGINVAYEYHIDLKERLIVGADARYKVNKDCDVFFVGENLFDENYEEFNFISGEPLFVKAGIDLRF